MRFWYWRVGRDEGRFFQKCVCVEWEGGIWLLNCSIGSCDWEEAAIKEAVWLWIGCWLKVWAPKCTGRRCWCRKGCCGWESWWENPKVGSKLVGNNMIGTWLEAEAEPAIEAETMEGARNCVFDDRFQKIFGGNIPTDCCEIGWDIDCCNPCISMWGFVAEGCIAFLARPEYALLWWLSDEDVSNAPRIWCIPPCTLAPISVFDPAILGDGGLADEQAIAVALLLLATVLV